MRDRGQTFQFQSEHRHLQRERRRSSTEVCSSLGWDCEVECKPEEHEITFRYHPDPADRSRGLDYSFDDRNGNSLGTEEKERTFNSNNSPEKVTERLLPREQQQEDISILSKVESKGFLVQKPSSLPRVSEDIGFAKEKEEVSSALNYSHTGNDIFESDETDTSNISLNSSFDYVHKPLKDLIYKTNKDHYDVDSNKVQFKVGLSKKRVIIPSLHRSSLKKQT